MWTLIVIIRVYVASVSFTKMHLVLYLIASYKSKNMCKINGRFNWSMEVKISMCVNHKLNHFCTCLWLATPRAHGAGAAPVDVCLCAECVEEGAPQGRTFEPTGNKREKDLEIALTSTRFYLHTKARTGHGVQSLEVPTECQEHSRYLSLSLSFLVCPELLGVYQALHYAFGWLH